MNRQHSLFTIGHSNLALPSFLETLRQFEVGVLADVRSKPQSHRFPQFNQVSLQEVLQQEGIRYLFLGEELGGRPDDREAYGTNGVVNYRARRKSFAFQTGIERVLMDLERFSVALLCAEEDPIFCHRFLMICPELVAAGVHPQHLRKGGRVETQQQAEDRLLAKHHLSAAASDSLFRADREVALEDAYTAQAEKCAFRVDPETVVHW